MIRLMNSAMMPVDGTYRLRSMNAAAFARTVREAHEAGQLVSYVGYPQTAKIISDLAGVPIAVSRESTTLEDGDTLLICRLRYRMQQPAAKGDAVSPNDFEFFTCTYSSI